MQSKGQALDIRMELQHVVGLCHLVATHGGEKTEHVGLVSTDDEVERLLGRSGIGRHVFLIQLFLIGNSYYDVAIALHDVSGRICFPKGFVLLQRRVEVHEVEKMIVGLFHCLNMIFGPGWLSPISSRRMGRRASAVDGFLLMGEPSTAGVLLFSMVKPSVRASR